MKELKNWMGRVIAQAFKVFSMYNSSSMSSLSKLQTINPLWDILSWMIALAQTFWVSTNAI